MNLFEHSRQEQIASEAPLAARMRPRSLDEYIGQEHVIGPGRLLRRAIQADQLASLIFYGPPGTGKTTLATVIANTTRSHFVTLNAVLTGVQQLREVTAKAQEDRALYGRRTILFVDEVHRWNKMQQDALLPWVENGTIIMIGATTENPYFTVNRPLLSRSRVFQLVPLTYDDLVRIAEQALHDPERGYGKLKVELAPDALDHLVHVSNGDARSLLNALALAVETTPPNAEGVIVVDRAVAEESIQQRAVLYDREGDYHFDTISAFIKSVRGSDPDAALYWLAKMVYAGEDPRFILRRLLILASEDIGMADPQALPFVVAAAEAFDRVGLPEGQFHLSQATLYLATTAKSNSALAYFDALETVRQERQDEVPNHLKDASRDKEGFGHGEGYLYPHAYRDHWVAQQYLPDALQGKVFYQPSAEGYEGRIRLQVARRREEQLAAMLENEGASREILTFTYADKAHERWLMRAVSNTAQELAAVRERLFQPLAPARHHLVLDLNAGTGLLTWEALRRVPEGGVWALAREARVAEALSQQASQLPAIERPLVLAGDLEQLPALLAAADSAEVRFDVMLGRNSLTQCTDKAATLTLLFAWLQPGGTLSLAELMPRHAQRLYALVTLTDLPPAVAAAVQQAEEAIYARPDDPLVNWDAATLEQAAIQAGFEIESIETQESSSDRIISREQVARWFAQGGERPSYGDHLRRVLSAEEIEAVAALYLRQLAGQTVAWRSQVCYLVARRPATG
jgi:putative ATPase